MKMTQKLLISLIAMIFLLGIASAVLISDNLSSKRFNSHSFTKAICDGENHCEDYEIACENGELLRFTPTGYAAQFSSDWKDLRDEETRNKLC